MSVPDVAAPLLSPVAWRAPFAPAAAVLALTAVFLSAVALPLATYKAALALFGLAHVGSELRSRRRLRLPGGRKLCDRDSARVRRHGLGRQSAQHRHLQERKEIPGRATAAPAPGSAGAR